MKSLPIGIQVYSVREQAEKDFAGTMRQIKQMGYDGVELAGLYGHTPAEVKKCLEALNLIPISAHVSLEEIIQDISNTLRAYKQIGCRYIAIPFLGEERRIGGRLYEQTIQSMLEISAVCQEIGMILLYHNHDFEFAVTEKGTYALDELYDRFTAEQLQTELDTCWVQVAGADSEAYLARYSGRCPLVHIKDFKRNGQEPELVVFGQGEMDIPAVVRAAEQNGTCWLIAEQDDHPYGEPMEDMRKNAAYLRELLQSC